MLTPEEILKMAENTTNSRDRAFILTFYESCTRIGEILPVKIKDCQFDEYGCKLLISGKTGYRPIRLIASAPAISNWLTNHPERENTDAFLFCGIGRNNQKEMLSYQSARYIIIDAAKRAGIKKRTNTHKFRASRATELSKSLSDQILCKIGGWQPGSKQLQEYIYLSGRDAENAVLELHGLIKKEDTGSNFKMLICPRCNTKNSPGSKFCSSCSLPLDEKTVINYDKQKEDITTNIIKIIQDKEQALKALDALSKLLKTG
jgi:integrase